MRLLELSRDLGYELAVTKWTVEELRTSLRNARQRVGRVPLPRRELAHLLATQTDEKSVVRSFWAAYRDRGVQPHDFFDFFDHFEALFEGHGIQIIDEGTIAVDQNRAAIDEQLVLLDRVMGLRWKEDPVMEHDVKHRLLVEHLRGAGRVTFSNARYWFITRDGKLPPYAMTTIDGSKVELPFCVATSAWLQVMRSFTPRTDDLDRTVVDLLASPFVTVRRGRPAGVVEEVVGRVDQAEQGDANLASAVVADTALVADIASARDKADRADRVDRAFEKKTSELHEQLEAARRREADSRESAAAARHLADGEAAALELERRQRRILEAEVERLKREGAESARDLQRSLDAEKVARAAAEVGADERVTEGVKERKKEVEALRGEFEGFKKGVVRIGVVGLVSLVAVGAATALLTTKTVTSPGLVVATVTSVMFLVLLAVRIVIGAKKGDAVAYWVFGILTVAGFVWFVADKVSDHKSPSPAPRRAPPTTPR